MKSKKIVDIVTIALLAAAFGLAYYTGLVGSEASGGPMLAANTFAIIIVCSSLVLMLVGGISELLARVKNNAVTVSFTAFMAVQAVSFVGMCAVAVALVSGAFTADNSWIRVLFIMCAAVQLLGYTQAVIYTGGVEEKAALAAGLSEDGAEEGSEDETQPEEYEYYYTDEDGEEDTEDDAEEDDSDE